MEGSGTSWVPTLYYRDSVTLNLDMSTQFAKTIPSINKDSLGVWLAENRWGNFMAHERWREALVMDLGRGSLLFPQLWGRHIPSRPGGSRFSGGDAVTLQEERISLPPTAASLG